MHRAVHDAYVGIGSNLGDPVSSVESAIAALAGLGRVVRRSSLYRTKPWGEPHQPDFINAVASLQTPLEPLALLRGLKALEMRLGRVPGARWGPRVIDLDLLTYDALELREPALHLPHPHLFQRAFVLVPLAEIDARYAGARDRLHPSELAGVRLVSNGSRGRRVPVRNRDLRAKE